jgi:hypothetical protein
MNGKLKRKIKSNKMRIQVQKEKGFKMKTQHHVRNSKLIDYLFVYSLIFFDLE